MRCQLFVTFVTYACYVAAVSVSPDAVSIANPRIPRSFDNALQALLSPHATISHQLSSAPRWSEYHAPHPGTIVNVATERDVQLVVSCFFSSRQAALILIQVQFCLERKIPFLAQNGGSGWIGSFHLGQNGVLVNLRGLNRTTFNSKRTQARVQGGALIREVIAQAYANDAQILTGNCNCVGTLGAALGGGYGYLMGLYGFSVDNILSMDVVLANGTAVAVNANRNPDLWWALRGAGPNFGIVTGATMKAYPMPKAQNMAWNGGLYFTDDKLELVVQAIEDLVLKAPMNVFMYFATSGPPNFTPSILVTPFYFGSEADGRSAFRSLLELGPFKNTMAERSYPDWNTAADIFCIRGDRKPSNGAGLTHMVPKTWRSVWNAYIDFLRLPGTGSSAILVECYSLAKAQAVPKSTSSFANRDIRFNAAVLPWYSNASLDPQAEAFGSKVRDLWRATDGFPRNRTYVFWPCMLLVSCSRLTQARYINFAFGDEPNEVVYDTSTTRLRQLKAQYDPSGVFNQWFKLSPL